MNKNIVIISIEALRPENTSLFGYKKETDKNLKKLAEESILFTKHFSSCNGTFPSLTSLFTGNLPKTHGMIHQYPYVEKKELEKLKKNKFWFPSYLRKKGYFTMAGGWIALWLKNGFDFCGDKKKSKFQKFMTKPFIRKILMYLPNWVYKFGKSVIKTRTAMGFTPADKTMDLVISKIKENKATKRPFFVFMQLEDTHFPFMTIKNPKLSGKKEREKILGGIKDRAQREYIAKRFTDVKLDSLEDIKNKYEEGIKFIDKEVGKLCNYLKKEGLWKETVFVVLGDHGWSLGEHGIYFSASGLYDKTIHIPLIMHFPGIKAKRIESLVQHIDIVPTIIEYCNGKNRLKFDGKSLFPLIKEQKKEVRDKIFLFDSLAKNVTAIRTKNKKVIIAKNSKCNLCKSWHHKKKETYDLEKDVEELNNLSKTE